MSMNVIELTGAELVEGIAYSQESISWAELVSRFGAARANQIVQEMAQDGFWLDFGGSDFGATYMGTEYIMSGGSPAAISSTTETALELAQSTELSASEVSLTPLGQGALSTGSSTAQTCSLLSLDVGVLGAAIAPILGVSLGANLYESNPQFWTKLSQKLLPFCYPGTTEVPGWLDVIESAISPGEYESNVVIDKSIYSAIKEFFEEEGIIKVDTSDHEGSAVVNGVTLPGPFSRLHVSQDEKVIGLSEYGGVVTLATRYEGDFYITYSPVDESLYVCSPNTKDFVILAYDAGGQIMNTSVGVFTAQFTYDNKVVFYGATRKSEFYLYHMVSLIGVPTSNRGPYAYPNEFSWYLVYGDYTVRKDVPEGASSWQGNNPDTSSYSKQIIYMIEDPNNPGTFIPEPKDGIAIAVPAKPTPTVQTEQLTKPDNWPEDVPWPMEIDFPWPAPEGVEDWPEKMPWPLPSTKPDWWPSSIPYPSRFPSPSPSVDPQANPDPNKNTDPVTPAKYAIESAPGIEVTPSETVPDPAIDPSKPGTKPTVSVDGDPTDPVPPPVPSGESPIPILPTIPVPFTSDNDGLISVYHPTDAQLKAFSKWLWVTYADPSIEKLWNNPFDGVIGLMEIYCTPTDIGVKNIRSGFLDSGISSQTISRYTSINCGSITVPEYYGDYFDYSPYSKCHIYLPFIGMVELNVDDIVGHAVNVTYHIDEYNGCCIAQITVAKSTKVADEDVDYNVVMYQFSGNCAVELPLAGGTQAAIRAAMMQAAAYGLSSVVGGIASGAAGNIGGAISQIGYGAANAVGSIVSAKSSVQHSGSFGSSYGALGIKRPYIVVTRPKEIIVPDYNRIYGYPAHQMVTIGACRGYLRVRDVHVLSSTATDDEKKRIEELLKEGVYVTET